MCLGEWWDAGVCARVEAAKRCHVHRIDFGIDARGAGPVVLEVEDAAAQPGLLTLADFAFAVEVPDWFAEGADDFGVGSLQDVVHMVGRDDVRLPAGERPGDTKETYEVGAVRVKELPEGSLEGGVMCSFLFPLRNLTAGL